MSKQAKEVAQDLEAATMNVKKAVTNVKEAADVAKTIDPQGAAIALGLSIFGTFMAPKYIANSPEGPVAPAKKEDPEDISVKKGGGVGAKA